MNTQTKRREQWENLLKSLTAFKDSLIKLRDNWPQIRKEVVEAQKNKPRLTEEEEAIVDALT